MGVDRETAKAVAEEIKEAARAILRSHGLDHEGFKVRTVYGDAVKVTIEAGPLVLGKNGVNLGSPEAAAYKRHAAWGRDALGRRLDPDAVGRTVTVNGTEYVLLGMNPRARKMPYVLLEPVSGKRYKMSERSVEAQIALAA